MDVQHQEIMATIRNHENEQVKMPSDNLTVNLQLNSNVEQVREYLEDPD